MLRDDSRWIMGGWIRKTALLRGVRIGDLRDAIGASRRAMTRYTKDRPGTGSPELPHVKTLVAMAVVLNVPIADAMEAAAKTVLPEVLADLRERGHGAYVDAYEHETAEAEIDTAEV